MYQNEYLTSPNLKFQYPNLKQEGCYSLSFSIAPHSIVRSFEVIVSIFAQQLEDGERFSSMTETILFVAESVSWVAY